MHASPAARQEQHDREVADVQRAQAVRRTNLLQRHEEQRTAAERLPPGPNRDARLAELAKAHLLDMERQQLRHGQALANLAKVLKDRLAAKEAKEKSKPSTNRFNPHERHFANYEAKWARRRGQAGAARKAADATAATAAADRKAASTASDTPKVGSCGLPTDAPREQHSRSPYAEKERRKLPALHGSVRSQLHHLRHDASQSEQRSSRTTLRQRRRTSSAPPPPPPPPPSSACALVRVPLQHDRRIARAEARLLHDSAL